MSGPELHDDGSFDRPGDLLAELDQYVADLNAGVTHRRPAGPAADLVVDLAVDPWLDPDDPDPAAGADLVTLAELDACDAANWRIRRLAPLYAERDRLLDLFRREDAQIRAARHAKLERLNRAIDWFETPVLELAARLLPPSGKRRSFDLPAGRISVRVPKKPRVTVDDEVEFTSWARVYAPHLVRVSPAARMIAASLTVPADTDGNPTGPVLLDGETVPGVSAVLDPPQYRVAVNDPAPVDEVGF